MPLYEYEPKDKTCGYCEGGFEIIQRIKDDALTECPKCGNPVTRLISSFSVDKTSDILSPKNIEEKGFTQYKKSGKGVYEKTAGKGPQIIKDS